MGEGGIQVKHGRSLDIQVISDLHIEFGDPPDISDWGGEILLMCGDIVQLNRLRAPQLNYLTDLFKRYEQVFWIFGNHEWYGSVIQPGIHQAVERLFHERGQRHLRVLENERVTYQGVHFIGATLWASFKGLTLEDTLKAQVTASLKMADFTQIHKFLNETESRLWTPQDSIEAHTESRRFITMNIASTEPCVVLTHHLPTYRLIPDQYLGSPLNPAFANHLEYLMGERVEVWACGHAHARQSVLVKGTRCVVNACGYPGELDNLGIYRPWVLDINL